MKKLILLAVTGLILVGCNQNQPSEVSEIKKEKTPHDFMFMQRAYPTGEIKTTAHAEAMEWREQNQNRSQSAVWEFAGPVNIGGRITDIEIPVDEAQTYYVGAASGGIFKTTDAGATWNPIFDSEGAPSIGDIEISKTDTDVLWVGTGEVNAGGGSLAYDGDGVYKSEDGGLTWESKGLPDVGSIGKVVINPNDEDIVMVAAMGPLFRDDNNRGVYRTTDGGSTWNQVLFVDNITGAIDMAIHPTDGNIVYAATWERQRRPEFRDYGGPGSGLHRSTDGGATWAEMTNGLPTNPNDKGRISIDISQSNPDVLYARYSDATGSIQGVYRTADGGDTWVEVNSSQLTNVGFHWWFRGIFVDPSDENTIYNVDFVVEKSTDGGNSWSTAFPNVHVDQHALAFNASTGGEVLLGNDGGFYKSSDDGASSTKDLTLPITQFYRIHVDAQNSDKVYAGSQDNGVMRTTTAGLDDWSILVFADGFHTEVDPTNTSIIYTMWQNGNFVKSINDGASFSTLSTPAGRKNWNTPHLLDPANPEIVFYGTERVNRSTNGGNTWTSISPDLTNGPGGGNLTFGTLISIDISPFDSNTIISGTDDGNVWITQDGGTNWNNVSSALPDRWVTKVLADREDVNSFYVTFSGYRYGEDSGHVYRTTDAGATWIDLGTSLPDIPINDIVKDSYGNLFLATDAGVFASADNGANWAPFGDNMPPVVVTDMHIHEGDEYLYAATYGRSAYKMDIANDILSTSDSNFEAAIAMYPNPASELVNIVLKGQEETTEVAVYDALGRIALPAQRLANGVLNVASLSSGVYYVKINQQGKRAVKRLIVK
ncbi:T9SS type A sorting domain-containing protein [Aureisphaera galaxeae]|uniref:VPS10 domain-containing protein n=1 Tax=Aureisphaera galaxeae TaxID=1538023 RepID=UPI0023506D33|nr:T9SS type A sorting domain-containing protein [Aureisphaera galaxeae]MDC8005652.1 T9SS type A sorting domain-containing protein [Aureisphaera galaxeae]